MPNLEREDAIMHILNEKKHVSVKYLAEHIYASKVTIRRDLKRLEDLGLVTRSYGHVTINPTENRVVPLSIREHSASTVKDQIARKAAGLIQDGSTIFMDGSSTVLRIANFLDGKKNLTVITNSLRTATLLAEKGINVYCTGGHLVEKALVCVGTYSENIINSVTVDMLFFSSQGLSADGQISDFSEEETSQRRLMIRHARKKYFLCDSSKLGKSFLFNVCGVSDVDDVICDTDAIAWLRNQLAKQAENKSLSQTAHLNAMPNLSTDSGEGPIPI